MQNSGFLKLDLVTKGLRLSRFALEHPEIKRALDLARQTGSFELDIILPKDVLVRLPVQECLAPDRPYTLVYDQNKFYVATADSRLEVKVAPLPRFYGQQTTTGVPMVRIGRVAAGYLAISPTPVCEFISQNIACRYCDIEAKKGRAWTVDEVLETVEAAVKEGAAEYICLNVGYTNTEDGGIKQLEPYLKAIKKHFDLLVCVQAQPPKEDSWIDLTYALGVDSLAYNLEVYDPEIFVQIAPGKNSLVGRERYFSALRYASKIFPSGAVVSNLIIGLEPPASTKKGIKVLTALGVVPTLPIYRPVLEEKKTPISLREIADLYRYLQVALKESGLAPTWISHFNMVVNSIDGRFFGAEAVASNRWQTLFKSRAGVKLAANISSLRRRLRVRAASKE